MTVRRVSATVPAMGEQVRALRDFVYLDVQRLRSMAAQLDLASSAAGEPPDRAAHELLFNQLEPALLGRADEVIQ